MKAVLLVSGGMDSLVATALAHHQSFDLAAMHVNYGQRTWHRELSSFQSICDHYGINQRLEVEAGFLGVIGGSSLTDASIPVGPADLEGRTIPTSYVPFRNACFLSMAVSWAEVIGANRIFIGAVEEDSSGYPDCRKLFYDAFNRVIEVGTKPETDITIITPLIEMNKSEIVAKGRELGVPFEMSWSCYRNEGAACGLCDSCARRLRAFAAAGIPDPLDYEARPEYH